MLLKFFSIMIGGFLLITHAAQAAQEALVLRDRTIIYADQQMTSPLGYVTKGKRVKVGEIPRNNAQVYPIVVSGKIGYIKVADVSTEKTEVGSQTLVAERFFKTAQQKQNSSYSLSYLTFLSQLSMEERVAVLQNNDPVTWQGVSLKGSTKFSRRWEFSMVTNFLQAQDGEEKFRVLEFGPAFNFRILDWRRLMIKWDFEALLLPFASYQLGSQFTNNGFGYTIGTGLSLLLKLSESWAFHLKGGFYRTSISGFDLPAPYPEVAPAFTGSRLGAGISYLF